MSFGAFSETIVDDINAEILFMLGAQSINVTVNDGVATLSGQTECAIAKVTAENIAMKNEGVTKVINLITTE